MKLIKTESYEGYLMDDLKKHLDEVRFTALQKFMSGQTGAIHKGKMLVYKWDYERFVNHLPVID